MRPLQTLLLVSALAASGQISLAGETVLLDFTADWCSPCQSIKPLVHGLEAAGYPVRQVDVDRERGLAAKYRVTSIPCFVMLLDGREVDREVGVASRQRLLEMLARAGKSAPTQNTVRALAQSPDGAATTSVETAKPQKDPFAVSPATLAALKQATTSLSPVTPSAAHAKANMSERLMQSTVRIKVDDDEGHSYGTGTVVDTRADEALVLTCGHIFRDSGGKGQIWIDLVGTAAPRQIPGRLISYDLKRDLGLVAFRPGTELSAVRVAPEGSRVSVGQRVINLGCNNGHAPTAVRSRVTAIDKYLGPANLEVAGMPVEGRSGGGLFNEEGMLIGVCFAADPKDNEGVYAGLPSIHAELERMGLASICATTGEVAADVPQAKLVSAAPPAMPEQMPDPALAVHQTSARSNSPAQDARADRIRSAPAGSAQQVAQLSPSEQATLSEIQSRAEDAEVICIIRPLSDPQAKSEIIVLDRASPRFLELLSSLRRTPKDRRLTSLEVPRSPTPNTLGWKHHAEKSPRR